MKRLSKVYILVAAALWGCIGIFVNALSALSFSRPAIVFARMLFAAFGMLVFMLVFDRKGLKIKLRDIWCFIGTGFISLYLFNICYFYSMQYNDSLSVAAVLLYTAPAFVLIFSAILFKEKITPIKVLSLIIMTVGSVLVSGILTDVSSVSFKGILFGLGSGVGYALYSIFGRYAILRGYSSSSISFYTFVFAALGTLISCDPLDTVGLIFKSGSSVLYSIGIGLVCCILPYIFYTKGLEYTENSTASIIATAEPMVASVIGIAFFDDAVSTDIILGILIMIAGIIIMNVNINKNRKEKIK